MPRTGEVSRARAAVAFVTVMTAAFAWLGVAAGPAAAVCECAREDPPGALPTVDDRLAAGRTLAVATRIEDGLPLRDTFRVEHTKGPLALTEFTVDVPRKGECGIVADVGDLVAVYIDRIPSKDRHGGCSTEDLDRALAGIFEPAEATPGGPPVAIAVGEYGDSRLAALDAEGRIVAWDRRPGRANALSLCPGGRRLVVVGDYEEPAHHVHLELTVHRTDTLEVVSRRPVPQSFGPIRCDSRDGREVQMFNDHWGNSEDSLVSFAGDRVRQVSLGARQRGGATWVVPGAFLISETSDSGQARELVRYSATGERRTVLPLTDINPRAVSQDGQTLLAEVLAESRVRPRLGNVARSSLCGTSTVSDSSPSPPTAAPPRSAGTRSRAVRS